MPRGGGPGPPAAAARGRCAARCVPAHAPGGERGAGSGGGGAAEVGARLWGGRGGTERGSGRGLGRGEGGGGVRVAVPLPAPLGPSARARGRPGLRGPTWGGEVVEFGMGGGGRAGSSNPRPHARVWAGSGAVRSPPSFLPGGRSAAGLKKPRSPFPDPRNVGSAVGDDGMRGDPRALTLPEPCGGAGRDAVCREHSLQGFGHSTQSLGHSPALQLPVMQRAQGVRFCLSTTG